jgi:hypothetical protein
VEKKARSSGRLARAFAFHLFKYRRFFACLPSIFFSPFCSFPFLGGRELPKIIKSPVASALTVKHVCVCVGVMEVAVQNNHYTSEVRVETKPYVAAVRPRSACFFVARRAFWFAWRRRRGRGSRGLLRDGGASKENMFFFSGEGLKGVGGFKVFILLESFGFLKYTWGGCVRFQRFVIETWGWKGRNAVCVRNGRAGAGGAQATAGARVRRAQA